MKKLLTAIAVAVFVIYPCVCLASYIIHLKDGREFATDRYYEEGDQIKFKRYGGVIGIQKDLVREIEVIEEVEELPAEKEKAELAKDELNPSAKKQGSEEKRPASIPEEAPKKEAPEAKKPAPQAPEKPAAAKSDTAKKGPDLAAYQRAYLDLKSRYEQAKKIYWKARRAKDIEAKEKALEEVQSLDRQLKDLENQVKEKNNGALPEWWK